VENAGFWRFLVFVPSLSWQTAVETEKKRQKKRRFRTEALLCEDSFHDAEVPRVAVRKHQRRLPTAPLVMHPSPS
jgi:hypothetical protein